MTNLSHLPFAPRPSRITPMCACQRVVLANGRWGGCVAHADRSPRYGRPINREETPVSQVERQSAQIVELIELLEDSFVTALADDQIDVAEAAQLQHGFHQLHQAAMDHDECSAIGIAILRTGFTSKRAQELLGSRRSRQAFEQAQAAPAALTA